MVRLMLVLAPVMCILSGIAISSVLSTYMKNLDSVQTKEKSKRQRQDTNYPLKNEVNRVLRLPGSHRLGLMLSYRLTSPTSVIAFAHYVEDNIAMIVQPF